MRTVQEQAEGMAGRIEHDPEGLALLAPGEGAAGREGSTQPGSANVGSQPSRPP